MRSIIDPEIVAIGILALLALPGIALLINAAVQAGKGKVISALLSAIGAFALISIPVMIVMSLFTRPTGGGSRRNACINNLRQIDGAKDTYSLEYGGDTGATITWAQVAIYVKDITNKCYCYAAPKGERHFASNYVIKTLGTDPACIVSPGTTSVPDHSLKYKS